MFEDGTGVMKVHRGKTHKYLGMSLDFGHDNQFVVDEDAEKLSEESSIASHHLVAKTLYVSKHARPDVSTAIAFPTTRVRAPDVDDWRKLPYRPGDKNHFPPNFF